MSLATRVANAMPQWPPITRGEAERAARLLVGRFAIAASKSPQQTKRPTFAKEARRCWISRQPTRCDVRGWGRLIYDSAWRVYVWRRNIHPKDRWLENPERVQLAAEMAAHVIQSGWLAGTLRGPEPKKRNTRDRLATCETLLARWDKKLRRAQNAIRKLKRRRSALARRLHAPSQATLQDFNTRADEAWQERDQS